ncbi:MAG TPA: amidohydrolase family protein [Pirellulales bacterium]|nr:amidohydrolase family protein [Pirellulales bacterium]
MLGVRASFFSHKPRSRRSPTEYTCRAGAADRHLCQQFSATPGPTKLGRDCTPAAITGDRMLNSAISRRTFLAASGAAFSTMPATSATAANNALDNVSAIDCQSHLFAPAMIELMEKRTVDPVVYTSDGVRYLRMGDWRRKVPPLYLDVDAKLATMDAAGIGMTALSINDPGPEWFGDDAPAVARIANDFVAGVVSRHPTRFFGLCVLPLLDMSAALVELDRAVKQLKMRGILLYTNLAGRFPDEPEFRPLFARAVELDVPVLLHPAKPMTTEVVKGYEMTSTLGNMFDNTIALTRLIMSGLLDEFPRLKLVCPHLGGTLPYIVGRMDHQVTVLKRGPKHLARKPSEYLQSIWLDIVSPLPLAIKFGYEFMGADRLLYASDHPWVEPRVIFDSLAEVQLSAADQQKIMRDNARALFRLVAE